MERRNFLKGLLGVAAIPTACIAGPSKGVKSKNVGIDFSNINMDGTFDEWIESIRTEIERLLRPTKKGDEKYFVTVRDNDWRNIDGTMPAKSIIISNEYAIIDCLDLAKFEFERSNGCKKYLTRLVEVRFVDMLWILNDRVREPFALLKRFDPDYRVEDHA